MKLQPKLLIIDMDNTLCDTFHTLSRPQWRNVAKAFEKRGQSEYAAALRRSFGKHGFVHTLKSLGMSKKDREFAVRIYDKVSVRTLQLYPDAEAILDLKIPKVLVTRGEKRLQIKKIRHLGLKKNFQGIYYIATFSSKRVAFRVILRKFKVKPADALVIGDRVEEEIKDANDLGIPSVLVRRPNWRIHKDEAKPTLTVRSLYSLSRKLSSFMRS